MASLGLREFVPVSGPTLSTTLSGSWLANTEVYAPPAPMQRPIEYRDRKDRVWFVSEVARLKVVSASIDGPNLCLVIRFEREGEERFARWIGEGDWREPATLQKLFDTTDPPNGMGPAPAQTVALWVKLVASMGPDELDDFERRTFGTWHRASLGAVRIAVDRRRRELAR